MHIILWWKVGSVKERFVVGGYHDGYGSIIPFMQYVHCAHVDVIDIGVLFAIHFDADEVVVHVRGNFFVFEGFFFYYMVLVVRCIFYTHEYGLV